jgi:hypothetical protein
MSMFEIEVPHTKTEIATTLGVLAAELERYVGGFDDEEFVEPQGEFWSPAGHLRHLGKSVRAVARGLRTSKLVLVFFGFSSGRSRTFSEMLQLYREALEAGGQAGPYGPSSETPSRELIMERWRGANDQLIAALAPWTEAALDRYRLPHPLLGKLTGREMLFFTAYHNAHHARRIRERAQ